MQPPKFKTKMDDNPLIHHLVDERTWLCIKTERASPTWTDLNKVKGKNTLHERGWGLGWAENRLLVWQQLFFPFIFFSSLILALRHSVQSSALLHGNN